MAVPRDTRHLGDLAHLGPLALGKLPGHTPDWLQPYHLCVPFTGVPLPALRTVCPDWATQRWMRSVFMMPFVIGNVPWEGQPQVTDDLRSRVGLDSLLLFLPAPELWGRQFHELTKDEWAVGSASAWWHLPSGRVLFADGIHTEERIQALRAPIGKLNTPGLPLIQWADQSSLPELKLSQEGAGS